MTSNPGDTTRRRRLRAAVVGVAAGALALGLAPTAGAKPYQERYQRVLPSYEVEDFCDVDGLTVREDVTVEGRLKIHARGGDGPEYWMDNQRITVVYTAGDHMVTERQTVLVKDLRFTDNADETITILVMGTGNATVYDANGKAIARNPGQTRFELLVDGNGDVEYLGEVFGSTGRNDDFCAAVVPVLAPAAG